LLSASGSAIVLPSLMLPRAFTIASSMILLPAVFETMSMLSRMGTPLLTIVPRVREKRATAIRWRRDPITGSRRSSRSQFRLPVSLEMYHLNAAPNAKIRTITTRKYFRVMSLSFRTNAVGAGSAPPKSVNIFAKIGMTYTRRTTVTITATARIVDG